MKIRPLLFTIATSVCCGITYAGNLWDGGGADWTTETLGSTGTIDGDDVTYTFPAATGKRFARLRVTGP